MTAIETLTQRNEAFASGRFSAELKIMPSMKTMIIGCVDPRPWMFATTIARLRATTGEWSNFTS